MSYTTKINVPASTKTVTVELTKECRVPREGEYFIGLDGTICRREFASDSFAMKLPKSNPGVRRIVKVA